jgi:hypothetical protein
MSLNKISILHVAHFVVVEEPFLAYFLILKK